MMADRRLFSQLFVSSLIIIIAIVGTLGLFISQSIQKFYYEEKIVDLKARAVLVSRSIPNESLQNSKVLTKICQELGNTTGTRITIISSSGIVMGDSHEEPGNMDSHGDRPEVVSAWEKGVGTAIRFSHTLEREMMYLAIPVMISGQSVVVRTSLPITSLQENITRIHWEVLFIGLVISLLAVLISFFMSKRIAQPLEKMKQTAEQFAEGNFSKKLPVSNSLEINSLAQSLNKMAEQLDERIQTILRERNEREAVLSSMTESVFAVDTGEQIISLNTAAAELFHTERNIAVGKPVSTIIRNSDLLFFIEQVLTSGRYQETELTFRNATDRFLNITGAVLHDESGSSTGAVFVLNDITGIRKLENIRKEFVANVSHELKTPITAIKGFIETLRDVTDSAERQRFLDIIENQSNRLNAIIEDLLELSRIERQEDSAEILLEAGFVKPVLLDAVLDCRKIADKKNIPVQVQCDKQLFAHMNAPLLQQAVVNLLDNAIKCSNFGDQVIISAEQKNNQIVISVQDFGIGIAQEHFERLFERFYRVDKARSRKRGGTGLGLAIVKHIAQVHGGEVSVSSVIGEGSIFSIGIEAAK